MKKSLLIVFLISIGLNAQHTISGNFSPAKDFTWLVAYHLKPGTQEYIADTAVKDGSFTLKIAKNKPKGIYRLVYAVPQEEFYFDVIYNGKEDIRLDFNIREGVTFTTSLENIPYSTYLADIDLAQMDLLHYYIGSHQVTRPLSQLIDNLKRIQNNAELQSQGLMVNKFIKANRPYIPSKSESFESYVSNSKKNYFKALDFHDTEILASGLITDKLIKFVFTALPLEQLTEKETEKFILDNINTVAERLSGVNDIFRFNFFKTLWSEASASKFNTVSDFTYETYLKDLALQTDNAQTVLDIEAHNRLRIGVVAPELEWKENNTTKTLSTWEGGENYLLVFWSSTCGHCLKELPALHKKLSDTKGVKVLAVGLEDNDSSWNTESRKLPFFSHTIALGRWDSEYADLYNIKSTPSYFILNKEKQIVAKPKSDRDVMEYFKKN